MSDLAQQPDSVTRDVFLGGKLVISQPRKGYRAGIDAVLLAAAVSEHNDGNRSVLDVGAGVGTVGLCAAARLANLHVVLLEREAALYGLAGQNIIDNDLAQRVRAVHLGITASSVELAAVGLAADSFDQCLANPPFHTEGSGTAAPHGLKAVSHAMPESGLEDWARFMARMVRPHGKATLIHKAEALPALLDVMAPRFGAITVLPIFARHGESAIRVLVEGIKGSKAPMRLRPGFVLHGSGQEFTADADAIFRHGAKLQI